MAAAGVNRPDLMQREGKYPPPPGASDIPGLEVAGTVAACGSDVARWRDGDQVCALVSGGGYAEYCVAPDVQCLPIPSTVDLVSAGGMPETFFTVWTNVFERGRLRAGESFLVHGGASGIGTTAIQMARAFGARVFATAGTEEKCRGVRAPRSRARDQLQDRAILPSVLMALTGGRGVDVILDMVGAPLLQPQRRFARARRAAAADSRAAWREGGNQSRARAAPAPHRHRIDVARENRGREGRDCDAR